MRKRRCMRSKAGYFNIDGWLRMSKGGGMRNRSLVWWPERGGAPGKRIPSAKWP